MQKFVSIYKKKEITTEEKAIGKGFKNIHDNQNWADALAACDKHKLLALDQEGPGNCLLL